MKYEEYTNLFSIFHSKLIFFDSDEANLKNKYTHYKHNFLVKYEILPICHVHQ